MGGDVFFATDGEAGAFAGASSACAFAVNKATATTEVKAIKVFFIEKFVWCFSWRAAGRRDNTARVAGSGWCPSSAGRHQSTGRGSSRRSSPAARFATFLSHDCIGQRKFVPDRK